MTDKQKKEELKKLVNIKMSIAQLNAEVDRILGMKAEVELSDTDLLDEENDDDDI